ncbi:hypothetical protein TTHERM_001089089 (macronuclear) [Tetrahymena thermophila SB210]|uniref:Uncharacterized protein n=1 Tax=Tetrahymena thermophila (strain SB210) TaxID=312017 RepID=W7XF33_TETTS|nr:hypothetical protein TTHERM_001089089 [Tetrahymena thermophila SB210]EWS72596.1 hypothetical protein TTHERM_001089089 [Tetrahymena thermophila SB210]|eukprot:XP_012654879.1 hypothetical protein TTHERM_001089089 [Tetrahymena thermophila SB210]
MIKITQILHQCIKLNSFLSQIFLLLMYFLQKIQKSSEQLRYNLLTFINYQKYLILIIQEQNLRFISQNLINRIKKKNKKIGKVFVMSIRQKILFSVLLQIYNLCLGQIADSCNSQRGYYFDFSQNSCLQCQNSCYNCLDQNKCSSCNYQSFLDYQTSQCQNQCKQSEYQSSFFGECQECKIQNCQICESSSTCKQCQQGWSLSQDQKACLNNICFQKANYFYNPSTQQCLLYCQEGQDDDNNNRVCSPFIQIGDQYLQIIPSHLYSSCIISKLKLFTVAGEKQLIVLCEGQIIFYSLESLIPLQVININGSLIDAVQQDNLIYILLKSNNQGIVATLNPLNQEISYQNTQLKCTLQQFSGQQITCFEEEYKLTQLDIFSLNQISFNYSTDKIIIVSSFAQNDLQQNQQQQQNSDRILETRNNNDETFSEKYQFRNLQQEKINFEPQPNQDKIFIKPLEIPFLQYQQINLKSIFYQFKSYNEINKVVVFKQNLNTLYYMDVSNPNNPLLAANLVNITSIVCQNQINKTITLVLSQQYTNYYSYLANIQYNLSSSQYYIEMIRKLDYGQGNLNLCLIDNQTLLTVTANKLGCQIYNLNNSDTSLQFSYNFTMQNNLIIEQALIIQRSFIVTIIQVNSINTLIKIVPYDQNGFQTKNAINYQISINYFGQVSLIKSLFYDQQNQILYISNQYEIEIISTDPKQQKLYANVQGSKMILNYGNLIDLQYSDIDGATYLTYQFGFSIIYDDFKKQPFSNYIHTQLKKSQIFGEYFFLISDYNCIIVDTKYKNILTFNIDSSNITNLQFKSNTYYALAAYKNQNSQYLIFIIQGYNQISSYQFASDPNFGDSSFFQIGNRIISQLEQGIFRQYIIQTQQLQKEDQFTGATFDSQSLNYQIVKNQGQINQLITFNYDTQSMMYYDYTTQVNIYMTICNLNTFTNTIYLRFSSLLLFYNLLNGKSLELRISSSQISCFTQQAKNYQIILSNGVLYRYNLTDFSNIPLTSQYQTLNFFIDNQTLSNFLKNEKQFLVLNINNNQTVIYDADAMMLKQTVLNVDGDVKTYKTFGQNQIALFNSTYAATIYDNINAFTSVDYNIGQLISNSLIFIKKFLVLKQKSNLVLFNVQTKQLQYLYTIQQVGNDRFNRFVIYYKI